MILPLEANTEKRRRTTSLPAPVFSSAGRRCCCCWQKLKLTWISAAGRLMQIHLSQDTIVKPLVISKDVFCHFRPLQLFPEGNLFLILSIAWQTLVFDHCYFHWTGGMSFQLLKSPFLLDISWVFYNKTIIAEPRATG